MYQIISKDESDHFLVNKLGGLLSLDFKKVVFSWSQRLVNSCLNYSLSVGYVCEEIQLPIMVLDCNSDTVMIRNPFIDFECEVDSDIASIIVNLFAYNTLAEKILANNEINYSKKYFLIEKVISYRDSLFDKGLIYAKRKGQGKELRRLYK